MAIFNELPLVEIFRRADLVELSLGIIKFGLPKDSITEIKSRFPNGCVCINQKDGHQQIEPGKLTPEIKNLPLGLHFAGRYKRDENNTSRH